MPPQQRVGGVGKFLSSFGAPILFALISVGYLLTFVYVGYVIRGIEDASDVREKVEARFGAVAASSTEVPLLQSNLQKAADLLSSAHDVFDAQEKMVFTLLQAGGQLAALNLLFFVWYLLEIRKNKTDP